MTDVRYFLDSNVLGKLTRSQREGVFIRDRCRIPSDVLREAEGFPDLAVLRSLEYPMTRGVLALVRDVMSTVSPGDFKLVHLYSNKGSADPALVACALHATSESELTLFPLQWWVVTDDKAVCAKALEFDVRTIGSAEFLSVLVAG